MRRCPRSTRCRTASRAPPNPSDSTIGTPAGPVCGSIATTGTAATMSTVLGATTIAASTRVPLRRESERRSQPWWSVPRDPQ